MSLVALRPERPLEPLPIWLQALIGLGLTAALFGSFLLGMDLMLMGAIVGAGASVFLLKEQKYVILSFIFFLLILNLRPKTVLDDGAPQGIDILAGLVFLGSSLAWIARARLIEREPLSESRAHLWVWLFMAWTTLVSIGGVIYWDNTVTGSLREFLNFLPLAVLPFLYVQGVESGSRTERWIMVLVVIVALALFVWNIQTVRSSILRAYYLFQAGRGGFDTGLALLFAEVMISLLMLRRRTYKQIAVAMLLLLSVVVLILSIYRTIWIALLLGLPIIFYLGRAEERKRGMINLGLATLAGIVALIPVYLSSPLLQLLLKSYASRFMSSANLGSDLSLINRYVEWRMLLKTIAISPFHGFGFGAHYRNFNYLLFRHIQDGFTHNGFLFVWFKAGIVGAVLLYGAYGMFMVKGWRLSRDIRVTPTTQALLRGTVAFLFSMLIVNYTLNIFGAKTDLIWIGLIWGYYLAIERKLKRSESVEPIAASEVSDRGLALNSPEA